MRAQCVLCDKIVHIENESLLAKRLKNHPLLTYLCSPCTEKINHKLREKQSKKSVE
ncbi:YlaI family protein [Microaerobacter geothermalis]|uniref:DUF2197 domain-containing protein n=1 Tax=Microaerobacter geothermalis TaxID=674972 RepID=UPI001F1D80AF|nr:DUF2197 domain-containing protein [Microaerobacter geothermalis]MCF6093552.1 YlaI family protein [Microaerobacter geothermalis]